MTICALVVCALVAGSTTRCQPGVPQAVQFVRDASVIATQAECAEFFHVLEEILIPAGLSPRRFEFGTPRDPDPRVPSVNELLRHR